MILWTFRLPYFAPDSGDHIKMNIVAIRIINISIQSEYWAYLTAGGNVHTRVHYIGVMMRAMASQITSLAIVYTSVYSGADQRKHQSSTSLAFVREFTSDQWISRTKGQ